MPQVNSHSTWALASQEGYWWQFANCGLRYATQATTDLCDSRREHSVLRGASHEIIGETADALSSGRPAPTRNSPDTDNRKNQSNAGDDATCRAPDRKYGASSSTTSRPSFTGPSRRAHPSAPILSPLTLLLTDKMDVRAWQARSSAVLPSRFFGYFRAI